MRQLELFDVREIKDCYDCTALRLMKQALGSFGTPCYEYLMACSERAVDACAVYDRDFWSRKRKRV